MNLENTYLKIIINLKQFDDIDKYKNSDYETEIYYIKLKKINNLLYSIMLNDLYINNVKYNKTILNNQQYKKDMKFYNSIDNVNVKTINDEIKINDLLFNINDNNISKNNLNLTFIHYYMTYYIIYLYNNKISSLFGNNHIKTLNVIKPELKRNITYIIKLFNKYLYILKNNNELNNQRYWDIIINQSNKYNKFIFMSIKNLYIKYNNTNITIYNIINTLQLFYNILNNPKITKNMISLFKNKYNLDIISNLFYTNNIIYTLYNDNLYNNNDVLINIYNIKNINNLMDIINKFLIHYIQLL
jgi:hypothetical protein